VVGQFGDLVTFRSIDYKQNAAPTVPGRMLSLPKLEMLVNSEVEEREKPNNRQGKSDRPVARSFESAVKQRMQRVVF
jgi:hypothetical protein